MYELFLKWGQEREREEARKNLATFGGVVNTKGVKKGEHASPKKDRKNNSRKQRVSFVEELPNLRANLVRCKEEENIF